MLTKQGPHCRVMLGLVRFEIEIPREEVITERRFVAGEWRLVPQDGAARSRRLAEPGEILLDGEGHTRCERAIDAVRPQTLFRIGVVRVQEDAAAWKVRRRLLSRHLGAGRHQQEQQTVVPDAQRPASASLSTRTTSCVHLVSRDSTRSRWSAGTEVPALHPSKNQRWQ